MVRGRVWKPRKDGFWHWQLVYREGNGHARVYSGLQREWSVAMAEMRLQHILHSVPGTGRPRFDVLGVDDSEVA